jgi:hypothetical protein
VVFTVTSHHPYNIPAKYSNRFKAKGHPINSSIKYSDFALQQFFEQAKKEAWFSNTLFVITADHTGPNTGDNLTNKKDMSIPIVFYQPNSSLVGERDDVANQIDVMPSILDMLHYDKPYYSLGKSLFKNDCNRYSINYKGGLYHCYSKEYCYQFNGETCVGFYNISKDPLLKNNLQKELPGWDFNSTVAQAKNVWNSYLSRIHIEAPQKQKEIFYSSLYRFFIQPSNIADVDGNYRGADDKIALAKNKAYYSTLSNWDIYRGAFPLLQILAPEKINDIVNSMLIHHNAAGFLPIWTAWGQDNYCMIGNHAIPMILSAYQNGFKGFDANEALQAMVQTSTKSHINSDWELYNQYGYYPFDKLDNEAVSRTLESGYDDWCVAEMAKKLGKNELAKTFSKRALYYQNIYDTETTFFRGKDTKGNWRTPFNPLMATSPMNNPGDYTEANAWQYFWTPAQHDVNGLTQLVGGKENFTKKLNAFFTTEAENPNKFLGQEAMIGQYAHGNEPSHHIGYLYAYSTEPQTGQKYIHRVINEFHGNTPNGMQRRLRTNECLVHTFYLGFLSG